MQQTTLNAELRKDIGSSTARKLRRADIIPAIMYGHKEAPVPVQLRSEEVRRVVSHRIKMVSLNLAGKTDLVLVKDVQFDTFGETVLHVDFERIAMDEMIDVECPVELVGTSKGAAAGGVVEHPVSDLHIRCLPANIPDGIKVGISHLEIGGLIHVRDIKAPEGVTILTDPEAILVTIRPPTQVKEVAPAVGEAVEGAPAEPEVIRRERAEKEEESEEAT